MNDVEFYTFLEHHGIKGMKWGVRNEARSALKKVGDSKVVTEARSLKTKIGDSNLQKNTEHQKMLKARAAKASVRLSEIEAAKAALPKGAVSQRRALNQNKQHIQTQMNRDLEKAKNPPGRGLTPMQKKLLVGAGVAAIIVGGAYIAKNYDAEGARAAIRRGQSTLKYGSTFKKNPEFARKDLTQEEVLNTVVKGINPNYGQQGGHMNCRRCTLAYELRRRGYDVVATTSPIGYGQGETGLVNALIKGDKNIKSKASLSNAATFESSLVGQLRSQVSGDKRTNPAETNSVQNVKDLIGVLSGKPNGARGEAVFNQGSFAHSLQWEIIDGTPHLFDAQKGQHFPVTEQGLVDFQAKWGKNLGVEVTRLDNVDLDLAFLSRWAENA